MCPPDIDLFRIAARVAGLVPIEDVFDDDDDVQFGEDGSVENASTGISGRVADGVYEISYEGEIIKRTRNPDLFRRFLGDVLIVSTVEPLTKKVKVYKASNKVGKQIPGYTTSDPEYAMQYYSSSGDFAGDLGTSEGGSHFVSAEVGPSTGAISEAALTAGHHSDEVVLPGSPNMINVGDYEYIILTEVDMQSDDEAADAAHESLYGVPRGTPA